MVAFKNCILMHIRFIWVLRYCVFYINGLGTTSNTCTYCFVIFCLSNVMLRLPPPCILMASKMGVTYNQFISKKIEYIDSVYYEYRLLNCLLISLHFIFPRENGPKSKTLGKWEKFRDFNSIYGYRR